MEIGMLKKELKALIVDECDKDVDPESITDDEQLIAGPLELDSLDALQISMAIKSTYGVRIEGGPQARAAFQTITSLVETIVKELAEKKADV